MKKSLTKISDAELRQEVLLHKILKTSIATCMEEPGFKNDKSLRFQVETDQRLTEALREQDRREHLRVT